MFDLRYQTVVCQGIPSISAILHKTDLIRRRKIRHFKSCVTLQLQGHLGQSLVKEHESVLQSRTGMRRLNKGR